MVRRLIDTGHGKVASVDKDDDVWFAAYELYDALGLDRKTLKLSSVVKAEDMRPHTEINAPGSPRRRTAVINMRGVEALIKVSTVSWAMEVKAALLSNSDVSAKKPASKSKKETKTAEAEKCTKQPESRAEGNKTEVPKEKKPAEKSGPIMDKTGAAYADVNMRRTEPVKTIKVQLPKAKDQAEHPTRAEVMEHMREYFTRVERLISAFESRLDANLRSLESDLDSLNSSIVSLDEIVAQLKADSEAERKAAAAGKAAQKTEPAALDGRVVIYVNGCPVAVTE